MFLNVLFSGSGKLLILAFPVILLLFLLHHLIDMNLTVNKVLIKHAKTYKSCNKESELFQI